MSTILRYILPALLISVLTDHASFCQENTYNTTIHNAKTVNVNGGNTKIYQSGTSNGASLVEVLRYGCLGVASSCKDWGSKPRTVSVMHFENAKSTVVFGVSWMAEGDENSDVIIDTFSVDDIIDYSIDNDMGAACTLLWLGLKDAEKEHGTGGPGHVSFPISLSKTPTYKDDLLGKLKKKINENKQRFKVKAKG